MLHLHFATNICHNLQYILKFTANWPKAVSLVVSSAIGIKISYKPKMFPHRLKSAEMLSSKVVQNKRRVSSKTLSSKHTSTWVLGLNPLMCLKQKSMPKSEFGSAFNRAKVLALSNNNFSWVGKHFWEKHLSICRLQGLSETFWA